MVQSLLNFPVEIQEAILFKLTGQALIMASKVCRLWHTICEWVAKERFYKMIPKECIKEIENSGKSNDIWLTALKNHFLQQYLINNMLDHKKHTVVELNENRHLCYCIFEELVFVGCDSGEIEVYNTEEGDLPVLTVKLLNNPVYHLEVMTNMNLLLAKTGRNDLEFLSLPYFTGKSWVYKMIHLKPIFQNFSNEFNCEQNFSISGSFLATATTLHEVSVFEVLAVSIQTVVLRFVSNYITEEMIGHVSIWDDEVIILFKSGEVLQWSVSSQKSVITERYHEIHYENPVWIFQGRVFCSTLISSQLLGYWHMNRGTDYWLIGKPPSDLVRCRDLGTMFSADTGVEDVLCVCLSQRLLACGTKDGKILLYYLSDFFFSPDELNLNGNEHVKKEFNRVPDLTIRTKERPIRYIKLQFSDNFIKIYTWPYMVSNGPGSKGLLQCIVLKEGDWVEQCDRDIIDI